MEDQRKTLRNLAGQTFNRGEGKARGDRASERTHPE